jgi:hypothetical protein
VPVPAVPEELLAEGFRHALLRAAARSTTQGAIHHQDERSNSGYL